MRITDYRNATSQEVMQKKYNPWIGISLGNKYFTIEHLEGYVRSCLKIAREGILVIIADEPHAINYEVFEGMKSDTAVVKALRNGEKVASMVDDAVSRLSQEEKQKVKVVKWKELVSAVWYRERQKIFEKAFQEEASFRNTLVEIVRLNMGDRIENLSQVQIEKLATYVLCELPIFMGAIELNGTVYDLHLYPGLSLMDDFVLDLQERKIFPEIMKNITIDHPLSIIEAYAN